MEDKTPEVKKFASISECGKFRYSLGRLWGPGERKCVFVMLNPSTADMRKDDPTIRRCIGFAKRLGFDGLSVVNLYAFRSPDPDEMFAAADTVGPNNENAIRRETENAELIIAAWGADKRAKKRASTVLWSLRDKPVFALSVTKAGQPGHPLFLKADAPLVKFNDTAKKTLYAHLLDPKE